MTKKQITISKDGIVREIKTGNIITVIGDPSPRHIKRFYRKLWWKNFKEEFESWASACGQATEGSWNKRGSGR